MTSIATHKQVAVIPGFMNAAEQPTRLSISQHCLLSELPGVVFGVITLVWIISTISLLIR
jgi:hypothetical protein